MLSNIEDKSLCTPISGTAKEAKLTVLLPVEGKIRLVEIRAKELGMYEGLELQAV